MKISVDIWESFHEVQSNMLDISSMNDTVRVLKNDSGSVPQQTLKWIMSYSDYIPRSLYRLITQRTIR